MMRVESWIVSRSSTRTGTDFCPVIHSTRGTWKPGRSERRTCAMPFQSSAQRAFSLKCEKRNCQRTGGAITHDLGQTIRRVKTGGNPGGGPRALPPPIAEHLPKRPERDVCIQAFPPSMDTSETTVDEAGAARRGRCERHRVPCPLLRRRMECGGSVAVLVPQPTGTDGVGWR